MPAVSFHGVTIAWSDLGAPRDPLAEMLATLPPLGEESRVAAGEDATFAVRFELRPASQSAANHPRSEGWAPSFFHGAVETFRSDRGFLIWDSVSRVFVPSGDGPIEAQLAPAASETTPGSTTIALQVALILALRPAGFFHLHAAALVLPTGVPVIVVGGSGAGKTTTTLALLEHSEEGAPGAEFLCDDSIYVKAGGRDGSLRLVSLPRDFHLGATTLAMFPRLEALAGPRLSHTPKRSVDPRAAYPGQSREEITLREGAEALALFPSIADSAVTEVAPLARAEAFGRLLGSSGALVVEGVPGREENLGALRALLGRVRCYEVRLGSDARTQPGRALTERVAEVTSRSG